MTLCTKRIWIIVFENHKGEWHTQRVAAWDFAELLSFYNEAAVSRIVKVEKTKEEVTYHY